MDTLTLHSGPTVRFRYNWTENNTFNSYRPNVESHSTALFAVPWPM